MKNKNISAYMLKKRDGKTYKVPGTIVSINESQKTVDMSFKKRNGENKIVKNISQKNVFVNESFVDDVRAAGTKVASGVKKVASSVKDFFKSLVVRLGKFFAIRNPQTGKIMGESLAAFVNVAAMPEPAGVTFIASKRLQRINPAIPKKNFDQAFDEFLAKSSAKGGVSESAKYGRNNYVNEDVKTIHEYWYGFIDYLSKPVNKKKSMNECMRSYNARYRRLNEAIYSLEAPKGSGIKNVNTAELLSLIKDNLFAQVGARQLSEDGTELIGETFSKDNLPILVWGAPGIGKTAILRQINKTMAGDIIEGSEGMNFIGVNAGSVTPDSFSLPKVAKTLAGNEVVSNIPTNWLPMIDRNALKEPIEIELGDETYTTTKAQYLDFFYNTGVVPDNINDLENCGKQDGGIILFDELSRMPSNAKNTIMTTVLDRMTADGGYFLATHWGIVAAANRKSDMSRENRDAFEWENAWASRFFQVNYVPTKAEWLQWATAKNKTTGEPNVDPVITDFISSSPDNVWYDAIAFGSRDLQDAEAVKNAITASEEDIMSVMDSPEISSMMTTWNPRTWTNVSNIYTNQLKYLLGEINPKKNSWDSNLGQFLMRHKKSRVNEAASKKSKANLDSIADEVGAIKMTDDNGKPLYSSDPKDKPSQVELERRWKIFYDSFKNKCDPSGELKDYKISNIKRFLTSWLQEVVIPASCGTGTVPVKSFKNYNDFMKVFSKSQIRNIWEFGQLNLPSMTKEGERYNEDDLSMDMNQYANYPNLMWKGLTAKRQQIFDIVLDYYPGGDISDAAVDTFNRAHDCCNKAPKLVDRKTYDKWCDFLSFNIIPTTHGGMTPILDKAQRFCIGKISKNTFMDDADAYEKLSDFISQFDVDTYEQLLKKRADEKCTKEEQKAIVTARAYLTYINFINALESGDEFLKNICNFIKFATKIFLESRSKANVGCIKTTLIGDARESMSGGFDIDSLKNSRLFNHCSTHEEMQKYIFEPANYFACYMLLKNLCESIDTLFKRKAD